MGLRISVLYLLPTHLTAVLVPLQRGPPVVRVAGSHFRSYPRCVIEQFLPLDPFSGQLRIRFVRLLGIPLPLEPIVESEREPTYHKRSLGRVFSQDLAESLPLLRSQPVCEPPEGHMGGVPHEW
jgi:hypothetical protein